MLQFELLGMSEREFFILEIKMMLSLVGQKQRKKASSQSAWSTIKWKAEPWPLIFLNINLWGSLISCCDWISIFHFQEIWVTMWWLSLSTFRLFCYSSFTKLKPSTFMYLSFLSSMNVYFTFLQGPGIQNSTYSQWWTWVARQNRTPGLPTGATLSHPYPSHPPNAGTDRENLDYSILIPS